MEEMRKSSFKFEWKIENFSYLIQHTQVCLESPVFVCHLERMTEFSLKFYPKGYLCENMISLLLVRRDKDIRQVAIEVEFSIIASDGSSINSPENGIRVNSESTYWVYSELGLLSEILRKKKFFLSNDTLTIICRIWSEKGEKLQEAYARTRIKVQETKFEGSVDNFSCLKIGDKKAISFAVPPSIGFPLKTINLFLKSYSSEKTYILFQAPKSDRIKVVSWEIYVVDSSHKREKCGKYQNADDIITLSLLKEDLLSKADQYLPNDTLTLVFEIVYTNADIEFKRIETYKGPSYHIETLKGVQKYETNADVDEVFRLNTDLYNFFQKGLMCDKVLTTPTKSFPIHSVVLSARSSIFRAMFSSNMKKNEQDIVPISDIDDDVLESLIQFIYKDTVDLQWDLAFKLYKAADKYKIDLLKENCALFLKENMNSDNVGQVLHLADLYTDVSLQKATEFFIEMHIDEVIQSLPGEELEVKNFDLVVQTLRNLHLK